MFGLLKKSQFGGEDDYDELVRLIGEDYGSGFEEPAEVTKLVDPELQLMLEQTRDISNTNTLDDDEKPLSFDEEQPVISTTIYELPPAHRTKSVRFDLPPLITEGEGESDLEKDKRPSIMTPEDVIRMPTNIKGIEIRSKKTKDVDELINTLSRNLAILQEKRKSGKLGKMAKSSLTYDEVIDDFPDEKDDIVDIAKEAYTTNFGKENKKEQIKKKEQLSQIVDKTIKSIKDENIDTSKIKIDTNNIAIDTNLKGPDIETKEKLMKHMIKDTEYLIDNLKDLPPEDQMRVLINLYHENESKNPKILKKIREQYCFMETMLYRLLIKINVSPEKAKSFSKRYVQLKSSGTTGKIFKSFSDFFEKGKALKYLVLLIFEWISYLAIHKGLTLISDFLIAYGSIIPYINKFFSGVSGIIVYLISFINDTTAKYLSKAINYIINLWAGEGGIISNLESNGYIDSLGSIFFYIFMLTGGLAMITWAYYLISSIMSEYDDIVKFCSGEIDKIENIYNLNKKLNQTSDNLNKNKNQLVITSNNMSTESDNKETNLPLLIEEYLDTIPLEILNKFDTLQKLSDDIEFHKRKGASKGQINTLENRLNKIYESLVVDDEINLSDAFYTIYDEMYNHISKIEKKEKPVKK